MSIRQGIQVGALVGTIAHLAGTWAITGNAHILGSVLFGGLPGAVVACGIYLAVDIWRSL